MDKIKKFRCGGSDWGRDATAADVMDIIGARIVVGDLNRLCAARRCNRRKYNRFIAVMLNHERRIIEDADLIKRFG